MKLFLLTAAVCYQNALFYNAAQCTDTGFQIRPPRPDLALEELNLGLQSEEDPLYFVLLRERAKTYETLGQPKKARDDWALVAKTAPSGDLKEEAFFTLASTALARHDLLESRQILEQMDSYYHTVPTTRGAFLSRFYKLQALFYQEEGKLEEALLFFAKADEAARGSMLPSDEKLRLWISYGIAHQKAGNDKKAKKWFNRAWLEEVVSSERLVAKQYLDQLEIHP